MANLNVTYDQMQSAATRLRNGQKDLESSSTSCAHSSSNSCRTDSHVSAPQAPFDSSYQEFTQGATRTIQGNRRHGRLPEQGRASSPADRRGTAHEQPVVRSSLAWGAGGYVRAPGPLKKGSAHAGPRARHYWSYATDPKSLRATAAPVGRGEDRCFGHCLCCRPRQTRGKSQRFGNNWDTTRGVSASTWRHWRRHLTPSPETFEDLDRDLENALRRKNNEYPAGTTHRPENEG